MVLAGDKQAPAFEPALEGPSFDYRENTAKLPIPWRGGPARIGDARWGTNACQPQNPAMDVATLTLTQIKDNTANPAPLGLLAFGMTTVLLNLHNAGYYELNSMILAMGICYGGIAQVIAGIMEWKKNNTFGTTAFTSYGLFWLSLVVLVLLPKANPAVTPTSAGGLGAYLIVWGVFTGVMFFGTLRLNRAIQFVFASLTILFGLLAVGELTEMAGLTRLAGYEGIVCGLSAMYAGLAQVLNEQFGAVVLPLGTVRP